MSALPAHAQLAFLPAASEEKANWIVQQVAPINEGIYKGEPETPSFLWTIPVDGDRRTILVFELYKDRDALYEIHFKSQFYFDIRKILATPDLLDGKLNLVNALPVAGFLTRPDDEGRDYNTDYTRCGKITVKAGDRDRVLSILKEGISSISSIPEIRSFLVFQPLDEVDSVYIWERSASPTAFSEIEENNSYSKVMNEMKSFIDAAEVTAYRVAGGYLSK